MEIAPKIIDNKLHIDGYIYYRSKSVKERIYWECNRLRVGLCTARAITNDPAEGQRVVVFKGPDKSEHSHPPKQEEVAADMLMNKVKTVGKHCGRL